ncbi:alpha-L-fucosidase [Candidatus Binatia bacterium]|nr:alpha-L-fucosidase [Candidatus Binatia bacterium]
MANEGTGTWFDAARFGLFVHWGIGSVRGWELSWPLVGGNPMLPACQRVAIEDYYACAGAFAPRRFEPAAWARLARRTGMQYAVLTTRHHDGFSLFDSQWTTFSAVRGAAGRDLVRPILDAFRAEGLRVGVYYSLSDWHHPDYPAFTAADLPYDFMRLPQPSPEQWERYLAYVFGQVRELLTNYGRLDVIWFDGQWERIPFERWRPAALRALVKSLQPDILINDRLPGCGDFETPEQFVPAQPPGSAWETCLTLNESWAYNPGDTAYKSVRALVHTLCEVAGRGGNLLLNVGPTGDGDLPPEQIERLDGVADWMARHGESIVGTVPGLEPWQFYGPTTRRDGRIYLHCLMRPYETVTVRGMPVRRIRGATVLGTGHAVTWITRAPLVDTLLNPDPVGEVTIRIPEADIDPLATVVALEVAG